jgi:class 3 adenylate cyclase/predicted ATPase
MDVAGWLRSLSLAQYEAAFREHEIDCTVLPSLTAEDLKDLGVTTVGHRRKMLDAIAALRAGDVFKDERATLPGATAAPGQFRADTAERRQLTVMFCDLVGSTPLAANLDPEDMRRIIRAYHRCCEDQIVKGGGFVAKYMGDGVLAYFGYPQAHEDDAERAVRSALALVEAVATLRTGQDVVLEVRIAIATGIVVVGDLIGEGAAQEQNVVGETANLAARLQALAEPGQVIISQSTRRLVGGIFEYRDLGRLAVRGLADLVQAWQVLGASAAESRFEATHETSLTPLVGREEELELLLRRWRQTSSGDGRVILLSGEPGIGKSRLTVALEEALGSEPRTRLRYFCSPHHQDSAFYPVITQLERAAKFDRHDSPGAKLKKLASVLGSSSSGDAAGQLLAELLSIPTGDYYVPINLSPQRKKEKTIEALLQQLDMLARRRPMLMLYEDVHWIDPSSREFLEILVERVPRLPVLLIISFRPDFQPPWTGQAHVTTVSLTRLGPREGTALVERVAGDKALPDAIIAEIVERTDGIPLFVEELTKTILEAGGDGDAKRAVAAAPLSALAVPASLHASLMARLDRLGSPAKEIAQIGAAIGREFSHELLASVAQKNETVLRAGLERLTDAGLVFYRGAPPSASYLFKHALIRDAAYSSLLRDQRQQLHARIAAALEAHFPELNERQPELLAQHYSDAGLTEPAIAAWHRAGERAAKRSANREAVHHLEKGLKLLETLPERNSHSEQELQLLLLLGPALMTTRSTAAPEIGRVYSRARELAQRSRRSAELFPTLWGAWLNAFVGGNFPTAFRLAAELFDFANHDGEPGFLLQAHHAAWTNAWVAFDLDAALGQVEAGLRLYHPRDHGAHALSYGGHDPGVCARTLLALLQAIRGWPDSAVREMDAGLELGRSLNHPPSLAHALWFAAELCQLRREPHAVDSFVTALMPLAHTHGSAVAVANATMLRGWARTARGEVREGIADVRDGLSSWRATGSRLQVPYRLARAADAYRAAGEAQEGLRLIEEAVAVADDSGDRWFQPELYRLRGEMLLCSGQRDAAEQSFQEALRGASHPQAKFLALRASTSLARLWNDKGKRAEARDLLAPAYGWFTEGFDTLDLKEAKALLDTLA